ncbi:hypothetical protein CUJ83_00475 [Methanocella sp. CWC-04]|uniref:Uncharacterized protein n=1 Tax=Methanooceanicella nereidis TaxID=2052831 RepID=A0AAP2W5U3_9EURY|nr:hypothetical protein [Methanocella sp. CWC-04]
MAVFINAVPIDRTVFRFAAMKLIILYHKVEIHNVQNRIYVPLNDIRKEQVIHTCTAIIV